MKKNQYAIDIIVAKQYDEDASSPDVGNYVFGYEISIINKGSVTVKLMRRHWWISNADGKVYEVEGEGVVGEQPVIAPGEKFSYESAATIDTPVGTMQGSYEMLAEDGHLLDVEIPMFSLAMPRRLH